MFSEQRVLFDTVDISEDVNDFRAGTADFDYVAGSFLYVGSVIPFNNLWVEMDTPNSTANPVVSIDIWDGNSWNPAVDIIDQSVGMTATGRLMFSPDFDKSWTLMDKSERVTGLETTKIYNLYWLRLSWDVDFDMGTKIAYIGQKLSDDAVLFSYYPDLNNTNLMTAFATGKTSWDEQHFMAAEQITRDLKRRGIIRDRGAILNPRLFVEASCHKVAEIIYTSMGPGYFELRQDVGKKYLDALNLKNYDQDVNADGKLDPDERQISTAFMTR